MVGSAVGAAMTGAHAGVVGVHHVVFDVQAGTARGTVLANVHGKAVGPADQAIVEGREEIALEENRTILVWVFVGLTTIKISRNQLLTLLSSVTFNALQEFVMKLIERIDDMSRSQYPK